MSTATKSFLDLTAGEIMSHEPLVLPERMSLREAARAFLNLQVGGAPVVDANGKCVGVLSAFDFVRLFQIRPDINKMISSPRPVTCPFQAKLGTAQGKEVTLCLLPPGVCSIQSRQKNKAGTEMIVCREPHCVLVDYQIVELERLPEEPVSQYMTADPVMVGPETPIQELALKMIDAHIHRVVVVDEQERPIGMVTGSDVLASVAYARRST